MKFIINADDFGISMEVNEAIYKSAKEGYISSSTIMAVSSRVEEAVEMTKDLNDISFGIHLVFDSDFASLSGIPENFSSNNIVNIKGLNLTKMNVLVNEFSKQIEKLQNLGLKISHIDTHHHLHLYPLVLNAVIKVAKRYNINKIRSQKLLGKRSWVNDTYRFVHHKLTKSRGFIQPIAYTDFPTLTEFGIDNLNEEGTYEIMCHPGSKYNDEEYFNDVFYDKFRDRLINFNQLN